MPNLVRGRARTHAVLTQDVTLTRACIGILGLFPMIVAVLTPVLGSIPIAMVVAGAGAVTFMAMLPRRNRR